MTTRSRCRPYWDKTKRRWYAAQYVNDELQVRQFVSEEAAAKWFADPLAWPNLPLRREGHVARKVGRQTQAAYGRAWREDE